jgi:hypothetical protein
MPILYLCAKEKLDLPIIGQLKVAPKGNASIMFGIVLVTTETAQMQAPNKKVFKRNDKGKRY